MTIPALFHVPVVVFLATLLIYWFHSSLPVSATKIVRWLGFRKHDAAFWPDPTVYEFWVRPQWATWLGAKMATAGRLAGWGIYIAGCHFCATAHLTWITGLVVWGLAGWSQALWCVTYPLLMLTAKKYIP